MPAHSPRPLRETLALEQLSPSRFLGRLATAMPVRAFGGEVAGQSVMAAGRTVPSSRSIHSAHAHFLRPGISDEDVVYGVRTVRDGGSYSTRQVEAVQRGEVILTMTASFHIGDASDMSHQVPRLSAIPVDELAGAAGPADHGDEMSSWVRWLQQRQAIDLVFPSAPVRERVRGGRSTDPHQALWLRASDTLPDDALTHAAAVTYLADLLLLSTGLGPHGQAFTDDSLSFASLDHTVWFHEAARADEWLLHDMEGSWVGHGRSLCRGTIFSGSGQLVATVMQEGVIRQSSR